jgi:hypothetical protein
MMGPGNMAEIVWVKDDFHLIDPESYERSYRRYDNRPLAKGYYIVTRPEGAANSDCFDESVEFVGPFDQRRAAESALRSGSPAGNFPFGGSEGSKPLKQRASGMADFKSERLLAG